MQVYVDRMCQPLPKQKRGVTGYAGYDEQKEGGIWLGIAGYAKSVHETNRVNYCGTQQAAKCYNTNITQITANPKQNATMQYIIVQQSYLIIQM